MGKAARIKREREDAETDRRAAALRRRPVISFNDRSLLDMTQEPGYQFPAQAQQWVMPLVIFEYDGDRIASTKALGTAFAIGPNLLLTAKHVTDGLTHTTADGSLGWKDGIVPHAMFFTPQPLPGQPPENRGGQIPLQAGSTSLSHDLAVFTTPMLDSPTGEQPKFSCSPLTIQPPPIGSTVLVLGYGDAEVRVDRITDDGLSVVAIDAPLKASRGRVEEYLFHDDNPLMPFPVIRGDFPLPSGMSGGPVIREDGRVCAVATASFETAEDEPWISYGSPLPYLFTLSAQVQVDGVPGPWSIRDLADKGMVLTDGTQTKVESEQVGNELKVSWSID